MRALRGRFPPGWWTRALSTARIGPRGAQSTRALATRVGLLGVCDDSHSSFLRGPAKAPPLIRAALASDSANAYGELDDRVAAAEAFVDRGDISEPSFDDIKGAVAAVAADGLAPLVLGGDHSITYPAFEAVRDRCDAILHVDAHSDTYDELIGDRRSHASPFARISELPDPPKIVQLGLRCMTPQLRAQAKRFDIASIEMRDFPETRRELRDALDRLLPAGAPRLYVSVDLDALDPAFAPGVSHHEPGGMSTRQLVDVLQAIPPRCSVAAADLVEYNPDRDVNGVTAMVAAKICKELVALLAAGEGRGSASRSTGRGASSFVGGARALSSAAARRLGRVGPAVRAARALSTSPPEDIDVDGVAYAFMGSQALFAALEMGVFDAVAARGSASVADVQAEVGVEAPRLQTLLTALVTLGALRRDDATHAYALSPNAARFLVRDAPDFYGDYLQLQVGGQFYERMGGLAGVVRGDAPASYAAWFSDPAVAERYSLAQHNGSAATARQLVRVADKGILGPELRALMADRRAPRILDVGGGTGAFSYVFAERGATCTVLDLPEVTAAARRFAGGPGLAAETREKVIYEDLDVTAPEWPVASGTIDVALLSYVSGSIPEPALVDVYRRARAALAPGGCLVIHDFMVEDTLDGPRHAALWALQHVTVNAEGLGLHPGAVADRLRAAGFRVDAPRDLIRGMTKVIVAHAS